MIGFIQMERRPTAAVGWITPLIRALLFILTAPHDLVVGSPTMLPSLGDEERAEYSRRRALRTDTYVTCCLFIVSSCLIAVNYVDVAMVRFSCAFLVVWVIVEIFAYALRVSLFSEFGEPKDYVTSAPSRSVILGLINYVELILAYACLYSFRPDLLVGVASSFQDPPGGRLIRALHFSVVTQLTVGYGDLTPTSWLRPVSWVQGGMGLGLVVLLIGRYVSAVASVRTYRA